MSRKPRMKAELERRATWAILGYAFWRMESALMIAFTLIVIFLYPTPFPWWHWWYWLIMGIMGEAIIIYTSIRDDATAQEVVADMFQERFNPGEIQDPEYRKRLEQALDYRLRIERAINSQQEGVLRDHLENSMLALTDWIANIFRLAKRLDAHKNNPVLQRDQSALPREIQHAEAKLRLEENEAVRQEIRQVISSKKSQLRNLEQLQNVMEKAEFQMENSLTALGTLYSQILLLDAKEVDSAKARSISQSIHDQVSSLQNIVTTMDEVYRHTV